MARRSILLLAITLGLVASLLTAAPASAATFTYNWDGNTAHLGDAVDRGDVANTTLNGSIVSMAAAPNGNGYWLLGSDGGVFSFNTPFYGSTGSIKLNKPVVGMSPTPGTDGYRFVASDGGVFAYGNAPFVGSMGGQSLNKPIVGMATTTDNRGYWLVASDGGIFAFGDAGFYGSTGSIHLNKPIVGMSPTPSGHGYWLVASDGGIFAYGDAAFYGSTGSINLNQPVVGMASTKTGHGYWLAAADGGVFAYGDASFYGSGGAHGTIVSIARTASGNGYWFASAGGAVVSDNYPTVVYPNASTNVANSGNYAFEYTGNGGAARWDPCSGPIHVYLSTYEMPAGADTLLQNELRELAGITGLKFEYDGTLSTPVSLTHVQNNAIEVGWLNPNEYTGGNDTDGYTQVQWYYANKGARMFSADVELLQASAEPWYRASAGVDGNYANVLKHEVGHAMGLWHTNDNRQVMNPTSNPLITDYQAGDLQGLADLSASSGCVR